MSKKITNTLLSILEQILDNSTSPSVLVLEMGHLKIGKEKTRYRWSKNNISYSEKLIRNIINKYKKNIRIIPTIIINDFSAISTVNTDQIKSRCISDTIYIKKDKVPVFTEKNLRNRIMAKLRKSKLLRTSYDRVFLVGQDPVCNIPIGTVSATDKFTIIPKCGLITYSYIIDIIKLAKERLYNENNLLVGIVSFSQYYEELESMKIGYEILLSTNKKTNTYAIMIYWADDNNYIINYRKSTDNKWTKIKSDSLINVTSQESDLCDCLTSLPLKPKPSSLTNKFERDFFTQRLI